MSTHTDRTDLVAKMADVVERGLPDLADALRADLSSCADEDAPWTWSNAAGCLGDVEQVVNLWTRSGGSLGRALAMAQ